MTLKLLTVQVIIIQTYFITQSKYIYWIDHFATLSDGVAKTGTTFDNSVGDAFVVSNTSLASGTDDFAATNAEIATAYEKFNDTENVDLSLLICGPSQTGADATGDTKATAVMDIATAEKTVLLSYHLREQM